MTEDRKALSRAVLMLWSSDDSPDPHGILSADYINHQEPDAAGELSDNTLTQYLAILEGYHQGFSRSEMQILMQIEEGDLVVTRWKIKAVQDGDYLGHPPTGKAVEWTGVQIDRHGDGKIVESWVDWDKFRMMHTLGFI